MRRDNAWVRTGMSPVPISWDHKADPFVLCGQLVSAGQERSSSLPRATGAHFSGLSPHRHQVPSSREIRVAGLPAGRPKELCGRWQWEPIPTTAPLSPTSSSRRGRAVQDEEWPVSRLLEEGQREGDCGSHPSFPRCCCGGCGLDSALAEACCSRGHRQGERQGNKPAPAGQG